MGVVESSSINGKRLNRKSRQSPNSPSMIGSENHLVSNTNYYKILYSVVVPSISYFYPLFGRNSHLDSYFSDGLVQPIRFPFEMIPF